MLERVWRKENPLILLVGMLTGIAIMENSVETPLKTGIELPCDPRIPLLGIHTEETRIERDTCTPMFIAALLAIPGTWKQPRCPLADEWIRKLWYLHTAWAQEVAFAPDSHTRGDCFSRSALGLGSDLYSVSSLPTLEKKLHHLPGPGSHHLNMAVTILTSLGCCEAVEV